MASGPLRLTERPVPEPGPGELLVRVRCCGVCRTDLHLAEGGRLGLWGFGGSAHLAAQVAIAQGAEVHVFTRAAAARELALGLGAASAQDSFDPAPAPLDSAIIFAPVGTMVPAALAALGSGGTLAIAGIYLTEIPALDYQRH